MSNATVVNARIAADAKRIAKERKKRAKHEAKSQSLDPRIIEMLGNGPIRVVIK